MILLSIQIKLEKLDSELKEFDLFENSINYIKDDKGSCDNGKYARYSSYYTLMFTKMLARSFAYCIFLFEEDLFLLNHKRLISIDIPKWLVI